MKFKAFGCLFIFLLAISSCKHAGKGTLVYTLEISPAEYSPEIQNKTIDVLKQRLLAIDIDENDILITPKEKRIGLKISGISNYGVNIKERIRELIFHKGKLEFWETYQMSEAATGLINSLHKMDSTAEKRFTGMVKYTTQDPNSCSIAGFALSDTMRINQMMDTMLKTDLFPRHFHYAWSLPHTQNQTEKICDMIMLRGNKDNQATISEPHLDDVNIKTGRSDMPEVYAHMSGYDAMSWKRMTSANIDRSIAMVVDGTVYYYPRVNGEITGGVFSFVGLEGPGAIENLVAIIKYPFPAQVNIVEEKTE
jgi:hypothetical protein